MNCLNCKRSVPDDSEFCPYCGSIVEHIQTPVCKSCARVVPNDSEFCPYCGAASKPPNEIKTKETQRKVQKKKFHWSKLSAIATILIVILVATVGLSIYLYIDRQELQGNIIELEETVDKLERDLTNKKQKVTSLQREVNTLEDQVSENRRLVNFVDTFVVFVEDDGTNLYHKYGCYRFKGNYFWAFNVDAARQQGYFACPNCCY